LEKVGVFHGLKDYYSRPKKLNCYPFKIAKSHKNLGSEELGSVYEGLLELHPIVDADAGTFDLKTAVGHERKTSGSYYTPDSLVQCLLDSALEPLVAEAIKGKEGRDAEDTI